MSTSNITINMGTYNPASSGSFCTVSSITAAGDSRVTVPQNGGFVTITPNATIKAPLDLVFGVTGPTSNSGGVTYSYTIQGIYFSGMNGSSVFTGQTGDGTNAVTVQDALNTVGNWEFIVMVQQVAVDGGIPSSTIGVIDPPIDNEQLCAVRKG